MVELRQPEACLWLFVSTGVSFMLTYLIRGGARFTAGRRDSGVLLMLPWLGKLLLVASPESFLRNGREPGLGGGHEDRTQPGARVVTSLIFDLRSDSQMWRTSSPGTPMPWFSSVETMSRTP